MDDDTSSRPKESANKQKSGTNTKKPKKANRRQKFFPAYEVSRDTSCDDNEETQGLSRIRNAMLT